MVVKFGMMVSKLTLTIMTLGGSEVAKAALPTARWAYQFAKVPMHIANHIARWNK